MKINKIRNGIVALVITASLLLLSDLSNRVVPSSTPSVETSPGLRATPGRTYKVGVTYFAPDEGFSITMNGLWKGLSDLGFVKDENLSVIYQHANGEIANLQPIHMNMDNREVDLIIPTSTPGIMAAVAAVKNHNMVFTMTYTPLEAGAGKSFTDHLPNLTGVGSFPPIEKTIDLIHETLPRVKRIGTLYNSSEANSVKVVETADLYCQSKGIELIKNTVTNTNEVYQAMSALSMRNLDAVWITGDNTALQAFDAIVKLCKENKIPLFINDVDYLDRGALAAVGIGWYQTGYHTASYVARVLNGEDPATIPIENYVDEVIAINQELAQEWGIQFPEKYLQQANPLKGNHYKFCLAHYVDSPNTENAERGIRDELKRLGLKDEQDFTLKVYNAQGDISTLNSIADAIAAEHWDLVFTTSTPTIQAISKKITDGPIVFTNVGDPIKAGLGKSFEEHAHHLTGISTLSDFDGLVKLVVESMPGIQTIGTIYTPGEVNSVSYNENLKIAAQKQGLRLISVPANSASEVTDAALSMSGQGIEAFTQISDNLTASAGSSIIKTAYNTHIPYFAFISKQVEQGAVAAVARDYYFAGVDAVTMAKAILEGTSPGDIPFRFVTQSSYEVNQDAMKYFKIQVPQKYLENK